MMMVRILAMTVALALGLGPSVARAQDEPLSVAEARQALAARTTEGGAASIPALEATATLSDALRHAERPQQALAVSEPALALALETL
ncbi:hypothetical protein, partial [Brevundimonas sp.]|uniref:hypothetical protein n=1 Tax=Brevundimonas sp. TaxID=1871086 RepID=UPI002AB94624